MKFQFLPTYIIYTTTGDVFAKYIDSNLANTCLIANYGANFTIERILVEYTIIDGEIIGDYDKNIMGIFDIPTFDAFLYELGETCADYNMPTRVYNQAKKQALTGYDDNLVHEMIIRTLQKFTR